MSAVITHSAVMGVAPAGAAAPQPRASRMARALFLLTHNSMALVGATVVACGALFASQPDIRQQAGTQLVSWLGQNSADSTETEAPAADSDTTALVPDMPGASSAALPRQQAAVTQWISKKYKVAPEPVGMLVKAAWATGQHERIDPALILAIMAIESSFNPFAQSPVGAQGLMQVMTNIHSDKYEEVGGKLAAFDPVSNMRVGVQVLKETIARSGSLRGGLKYYVGAANLPSDGGYGDKVLAEYARIRAVADGRKVAANADLPVQLPAVSAKAAPAEAVRVKTTVPAQPAATKVAMHNQPDNGIRTE